MKKLMTLMIATLLLGMLSANAQKKVVRVYPKHGTVVTTIHKPKVFVHKGKKFHYSNGIWYKARKGRFVVSAAPRGVVLRKLPAGATLVVVKGKRYYQYKGIRYHKRGGVFVVV